MYSAIVKDHFSNPRNVGEITAPDASGSAKNESDGDHVELQLRLDGEIIREARIRVSGCVAAIASASFFSEWLRGKTLGEAMALTREELAELMGGLPPHKIRCSLTCMDALKNALDGRHQGP